MEKIIIIGGRGSGVVVADQISDAHDRYGSKVEVLGFSLEVDRGIEEINGYPMTVTANNLMSKYGNYPDVKFLYLLYRPDKIEHWSNVLYSLNIPLNKFTNFIHPSVMIAKSAKMGVGNVFLANTVVNANFVMGNFNTVNSMVLLGHDTSIGNNNYFAGHVSVGSNIKIGNMNFFGLNTTLKNEVTISDCCIVGMASNVVKNLDSGAIAYGNPAKAQAQLNHVIR